MPSGKMLIIMTGFEGWAPNQDLKAKQGGFAVRAATPRPRQTWIQGVRFRAISPGPNLRPDNTDILILVLVKAPNS